MQLPWHQRLETEWLRMEVEWILDRISVYCSNIQFFHFRCYCFWLVLIFLHLLRLFLHVDWRTHHAAVCGVCHYTRYTFFHFYSREEGVHSKNNVRRFWFALLFGISLVDSFVQMLGNQPSNALDHIQDICTNFSLLCSSTLFLESFFRCVTFSLNNFKSQASHSSLNIALFDIWS